MRFSLRWMLAVMAYVALVAAAMGTWSDLLVDLVWAAALVAICYATVVAFIDRGRPQAMAAGFAAMATIHIACVVVSPDRAPVNWAYNLAGYWADSSGDVYDLSRPTMNNPNVYQWADSLFVPQVRLANGVMTLITGLFGCLIGMLAWRHRKQ